MEQAVQICEAEAGTKNLTVRVNMGDRDWHVLADPSRTMQVLWNLLNNAVKYTHRGGRIDVRCAPAGTKMVRIEIIDTGVGMEPDLLARIFDAFEQGEGPSGDDGRPAAQRAGLGLGLAIARALVEGHGGRIGAESAGPGRGSTFRIELPLAEGGSDAHTGRYDTSTPPVAARRVLRMLLIEDHEDSAEILSRLLARDGAEVRVARCGQDALAEAAARPFDVVISDIGLPDIPGYELLPRLLAQQPGLRGIALSGFGMEEDVARCREAGFRKHLTKPVDFQKLRAVIRSITED
jgi:two-component system CheB/CheR fusion protein